MNETEELKDVLAKAEHSESTLPTLEAQSQCPRDEDHFGADLRKTKGRSGQQSRRWALRCARCVLAVFRPRLYPTVAFFLLLTCTYLSMLSFLFRLYVLALIFGLTLLFPHITVLNTRRRLRGNARWRGGRRMRLLVDTTYALFLLIAFLVVWDMGLPSFAYGVLVVALGVQVLCSLIRLRWRICLHSAAVGAFIGVLPAYAPLLGIDPLPWLCVLIALSGLVSSSRMLLRRHTLPQVLAGTWLGILCGFIGIYSV